MADTLASLVPADPDAQATVTDFLDYTEWLPADLVRSLSLIRKLDEGYIVSSAKVHELTKLYGQLPSLPAPARPDPQVLRGQISHHLTHALDLRGSSFAEASRLYDVVDHHFNRLSSIISKLQAVPSPAAPDPSSAVPDAAPPPPQRQSSRARKRAAESEDAAAPKLMLRGETARSGTTGRTNGAAASPRKERSRRVTVPGEVLPPRHPDSPPTRSVSEWEWPPASPVPEATSRVGQRSRSSNKDTPAPAPKASKAPKPSQAAKASKPEKSKPAKSGPLAAPKPGMGTNVHSAVAGISTTNALALLKPPPADAVPGSADLPWLKLTPWEMARLRKRMKKNAVWVPSETMVRRELALLHRGPEAYHAARAQAAEQGQAFVDDSHVAARMADGGKAGALAEGEIGVDSLATDEMPLSNRGLTINDAKKLKKEVMQREAAALAAEEQARFAAAAAAAGDGDSDSSLSTGFGDEEAAVAATLPDPTQEKRARKASKKRMRSASPEPAPETVDVDVDVGPSARPKSKKRKPDGGGVAAASSTVPLAASGTARSASATVGGGASRRRPASVPSKRMSSDATVSRPRSRGAAAAAAAAADHAANKAGRKPPRRASTLSTAPIETARPPSRPGARRSKRPVPGQITTEGGPAVTVGKRTAAPRSKPHHAKRAHRAAAAVEEAASKDQENDDDEADLPVDPNEPRYCVCGDVSFGTMVMCENGDCEKEWFHLECVGLSEPPGRTTKWYCPDCRKRFGVGEKGQGSLRNKKK